MLACAYRLTPQQLDRGRRRPGEASTEGATPTKVKQNEMKHNVMTLNSDAHQLRVDVCSAGVTEQFLNSTPSQRLSVVKFVPGGRLGFLTPIKLPVVKREPYVNSGAPEDSCISELETECFRVYSSSRHGRT